MPVADQQQERVGGSPITYLLALDPSEAERVIFMTSNEGLYIGATVDVKQILKGTWQLRCALSWVAATQ